MRTETAAGIVLFVLFGAFQVVGQQADRQAIYRLSLPDTNWALDISPAASNVAAGEVGASNAGPEIIPAALFHNAAEALTNDGRERRALFLHQFDKKAHSSGPAFIAIHLRPALTKGGAADFRAFALKDLAKRVKVEDSSIKTWEYKQIPVARYTLPGKRHPDYHFAGPIPIVTNENISGPRNMEAYFVKDDVWVTVTLWGSNIDDDKEKFFYSLLDSIKFVDMTTPATSFDFYEKGKSFYLREDFKKAVEYYSRALEMELRERQLETNSWRKLVKELSDAYGATGNVDNAKTVLDSAVTKDPAYPWFYYYLARIYAFRDDLDNTIDSLNKAFSHKDKTASWLERLPKPTTDPSFKRYWKDEKFRKAVGGMKP